MSRRWLSSAAALSVLLALTLTTAVESSIIHKVARSFAFSKFPEANLLHRAHAASQLVLQHDMPIELEVTSSVGKATTAAAADEKLPTDVRTPVENDAVTKALDHIPSDSLPSDALPTPAAVTPIEPVSAAGNGGEDEMRFRAESEEQSQTQIQTKVTAAERLEDRRARSRTGFMNFGGMGKRFQQQKDKLLGKNQPHVAEVLEDCMGCRYIWNQVEMDVANARYVEDVQASFEHNCLDAQKAPIFYNACEDMYDDMYAMTDDYMSQRFTVDDMCMRAKMCDDPSKKKFSLFP